MSALKKVGFIGTGIMGSAMAGHLIDAGFELSVYNRTKSKAQGLIDRGAHWCDTVGELAAGQDVIITIIGYPKDVEAVYLGAGVSYRHDDLIADSCRKNFRGGSSKKSSRG